MPVKSEKQRRFMYASLSGETDVPPSVAKKFVGTKAHKTRTDLQSINKPKTHRGKMALFSEGGDMKHGEHPVQKRGHTKATAVKMAKTFAGTESPMEERMKKVAAKKAGMSYKAAEKKFEGEKYARGGGVESKGKTKGKMVKMAMGGKAC